MVYYTLFSGISCGNFFKRSKPFPLSDHFINSHYLSFDIVRKNLMLVTLGTYNIKD